MKKIVRFGVLCGVLTLLLCVSAFAAGEKGVYGITQEAGFSITAKGETKALDVDNNPKTAAVDVYLDAVKVSVTYSSAVSSKQYLLLVTDAKVEGSVLPDVDNIQYINQLTATGSTVAFDEASDAAVYPQSLKNGTTYYIYLISNDGTLDTLTLAGTFQYYSAYKLGDVSCDGAIKANDATLVLKHVAKMVTLDGAAALAAECSGDGAIKANDATLILKHVAKMIDLSTY